MLGSGGQEQASKLAKGQGVWVPQFSWLIFSKIKRKWKWLFRDLERFFWKSDLSLRWDCIGMIISQIWGFEVHLSLKTLLTRNKNLKVTFCNLTEPHHCKSKCTITYMLKFFLELSLIWFLMQKLWISDLISNVLHSQNVRIRTYIHSGLSIWLFGISCAFIECFTKDYHGLLYALPYMLLLLWTFCTIFISHYFQHITRSVTECSPVDFQ